MTRKPDGTWDKSQAAEPACDRRAGRAPHRSYYYAMGLGTQEIEQPFVGVASCWNRGGALQHRPDAPGRGRLQTGVKDGGRHAARVPPSPSLTASPWATRVRRAPRRWPSRDAIADPVEPTMRGYLFP